MEQKHFESLYPKETRLEEIKKILEFISSGKSCQVIGMPGIGKSSCMRLLPYNKDVRQLHLGSKKPSYHFVYMDFSEVAHRSLADIIKFILISLAGSFGERKMKEDEAVINNFLKEALKLSDEMVFSQSLKKSIDYLANEKGINIVFLFDRFEEYVPSIDSRFFLNLKILRNRAKYRFTTVFALDRPLEDILEAPIFAEFHEFLIGNNVFLPMFDRKGLEFRFSHLEEILKKTTDEKTKVEIVKLTGGHGKTAKVALEAILANEKKIDLPTLSEFLLSKNQVKAALFEIWQILTPEEKNLLLKNESNEFLGIIGLTNNGKITIPLFEDFIKTLPKNDEGKLSYASERNEILKNGEDITEKFSSSEFKLLRFLLKNSGRICEKDEIISNVWKDTKTQEGVTDQALDQIIYRLRKKIEENPNKPQFIQTIKGRGYKLTP